MKTINQLHYTEKPREKLISKGVKSLKDYELVAVLLGSGIKGKDVIKLSKEIVKVLQDDFASLNLDKLLCIHGLGSAKSSQLISAIELSKRYLIKQNKKITSASDVYDELKDYQDKQQEYFLTIYLDGANHICETRVITIGTLNRSLVHPREVFAPAIESRCASIIVAHNHPSGICEPSDEDLQITNRLKDSGKLLGIEVLDHVILSKNGFLSMRDEGIF
ncbi:MAG: DNA repair protein RadC [Campylobacteraceae bacterium]|jgi:DNA repair protein RadC|nr:DNA repair protein RadC [Campylobacteraceae bacterium]MBT3882654.1 DNA repair protein RadC [Campylobacteraceae bacterium]MBT4031091.1 DNA repair protein RadC [Campylobacteraceae bacterium]MBT4179243.1 DNA repair protein RadC [Campylobacteraceae bacterium]MBT4572002.1 DNA repair protein RadC [Campylobacteraceae bacterium]